jgi:hypothetical protein
MDALARLRTLQDDADPNHPARPRYSAATDAVGDGREFSIGRGRRTTGCCPIRNGFRRSGIARSGRWQIADLSNGLLNYDRLPISHGQPRELRDGNRLRLVAHEIELRFV